MPLALALFGFLFGGPLSTLAVAGGAVSVPIIIHLLNRRRFRVVTWAAMRFLLQAQRKNARRMRLEQWLLLALRCLVLLLLVLAMASVTPWAEAVWHWANPEGGKGPALGGTRAHKILVLDGSFSMGLRAGEATCFDRARALAEQIVGEGAGGDGFSVVLMAAPPRRIVPEPSEDARKVAAEVRGLHLTHGNADLAATLHTVESLLQSSPGKFAEKEVYFLTDLQQSTWIARQPGTLAPLLQKIQARARTVFVDVGQEGASNLAVTGLALGEPVATTGRETPLLVTLHNYGETRDEVMVRLFVTRARDKKGRDEPPREVGSALVRADRGQQTSVAFKYKFPEPGDYALQVRVAGDALDLDDVRAAVVTVKDTVPVMLVNGKPAALAYDRATEWLRTALNPFGDEPAPANVVARPRVLSLSQFADEGLGDLAPFDAVFLCDVPRLSPAAVRRLERHVRRGGGVVFCLGPRVDVGAWNEALYRDGAGLLPARLVGRQRTVPGYEYQLAIAPDADREDPLRPFRDSSARELLLACRFYQFVQTQPAPRASPRRVLSFAPAAIPGKTSGRSAPPPGGPALLEWNPPAGRAPGAGRLRGRVALVTTTVNSDWNNWPASPSFPPLMQELLDLATSGRLREQAVNAGEALELFLPGSAGGQDALLVTPDGRKESARTLNLDEGAVLRWTDTDVSGLYRATIGQHPQESLFAVNVPAVNDAQQSESNLARTSKDELQKVYPEWEVQVVTDPGQVVRTPVAGVPAEVVQRPMGPGIAHGLLLAVLVLVLLEVVLAWHFGHYSGTAGQAEGPAPRARPAWLWGLLALPWLLFALLGGVGVVLALDAAHGEFLGFLPDTLRRGVETVMGIPAPAAGEGSHWRLEYLPYLRDAHSDPWLVAGLALASALLVLLVYRREGHAVSVLRRLLLVGLRMGLLLLLLVVFLPQLKVWFERQGWPDVVLLIDDSRSMSTVDRYQDTRIKAAAEQLARRAGLTEADRLHLAQALLTRPDGDWLTALLSRRQVRLHVYHCSSRAHRFADATRHEEVPDALAKIRALEAGPQNDSSQLGVAVRQVLNDFRGSSLAAVIMLTDGVTTEGEDLVKVSKYAAQVGVPLYFVGIGDAQEARDVYLHDLQVEDSVYVHDRVVFDVKVTAKGYAGLSVPVTLREKGKKQPLATRTVPLDATNRTGKVSLVHQPNEPGEKVYEIVVPVQEDEVNRDNNRLERQVFVHESKLIKVLYVEGYRRYEYHYLKTLLERESARIKGNKSIDLKVLLVDADPDFAAQDRTALAEFPSKEELKSYDVVILGDVNPNAGGDGKMTQHLKDLADFVRERGGGLLMIAGERFAPRAYRDTPLKDVLPIDVTAAGEGEGERGIAEGYRPDLTAVGRMHPIFRFSNDEKENEEVFNRLREMYWYAEGYQPKRAAEVLAVHPRVRATGEKAERDGSPDRHPLVVQQFVGAGRAMFLGFDETWRWGFREDQRRFNDFWIRAVRYLARSRLGRVELRLDRQTPYRKGEPIKISVRFPDDAPPPPADTRVTVVEERHLPGRAGGLVTKTIQLARLEGSRATYEALETETPEGEYRFRLTQPSAKPQPRAECRVLAPPGEMERVQMNQADLERAAEESHGRFYSLADADQLPDDLPAGTRVTVNAPAPPWLLWNRAALFVLALLLLTTEWTLRKQMNLL